MKKIADYVSDGHAADGIMDGINYINEQIEKRKATVEQTRNKEEKVGDSKVEHTVIKRGDTQSDETENR